MIWTLHRGVMQIVNKLVKRYSMWLIIRELQIKTTVKIYLPSLEWLKSERLAILPIGWGMRQWELTLRLKM